MRAAVDLSYARVFYRTYGDRDEAESALEKANPYLRRCLAERLKLRRVPELDFRYDESQERAQRVEGILSELEAARDPDGRENAT